MLPLTIVPTAAVPTKIYKGCSMFPRTAAPRFRVKLEGSRGWVRDFEPEVGWEGPVSVWGGYGVRVARAG